MKWAFKFVAVVALLCGLFVFGYSWRDVQRKRLPTQETLATMVGMRSAKPAVAPVKVFREAYVHIQQDFAKPVDATRLKYAGLSGLMSSLGDPHTVFMEPRATADFRLETTAQFAGIGARLGPDPLGARVAIVFENSPASRAGLKAGDLVSGVDGKSVSGQPVDSIVEKIRGPEGTRVRLSITRPGVEKPIQLSIERAKITTPTVVSKMLPESIGYINITIFSEPTAHQFLKSWETLERDGLQGLIIDLRGNPGGLLEVVTDVLSLFVENKTAVTLKKRDGAEERSITLVGQKRDYRYPVVLLVNEDSASASEIMAGVLKDYGLTTLVGEHTYGKASVQNVVAFRDGSSAKLTIARYYLPSGVDISRKIDDDGVYVSGGIRVDVEVKLNDDPPPVFGDPKTDNQLAKAIEVVQSKMKRAARMRSTPPMIQRAEPETLIT